MPELNLKENSEKILSSIKIPPRPTVIGELLVERNKLHPNMRVIAQLISRDVALSVAMMKTANSSFFGLSRKVDSPQQAATMLGLDSTINIITGLSLKAAMGTNSANLESFWDDAEKTANIAAYLSTNVRGMARDLAYSFGLFHDCGIPLLMQRFPDYVETLRLANAETEKLFTDIEDDRHSTNHATMGYLLAKSWALPEALSEAILYHHDLSILTTCEGVSVEACNLIALSYVAEHVRDYMRMSEHPTWKKYGPLAMDQLGITMDNLNDIKEEIAHQ